MSLLLGANQRRTIGSCISSITSTSAASTALIGRVKKGSRLPSDSTSPRRSDLSTMSPSTRPSTKGATGKPRRRSQKQAMPTPSITHTSNSRCVIEYEPSTHSTKTMGMMIVARHAQHPQHRPHQHQPEDQDRQRGHAA